MFWVQVPLAVGTAAAAWAILPRAAGGSRRSLDAPALALGTIVLLGINGALLQADAWGWTSVGVVGGFAVAVLALVAFVWRERTTPEPAVRLEILRSRAFVVSTLVGAAAWFGILSGSVQLAVYLQEVRGLTPTETALVLLPWPLLAALIFPRGAAIVARFGAPRMMVLSLAFALAAAVLMLAFDPTTPLLVVSAVAALGGVPDVAGRRGQHHDRAVGVRPRRRRDRRGVFNSLRQVGSALGVAIPAAAFDLAVANGATDLMPGSHAAFLSRVVVFALSLLAVLLLLRRPLAAPATAAGPAARPAGEPLDSAA